MLSHKIVEFNGLRMIIFMREGDKQPQIIPLDRFFEMLNYARGNVLNQTINSEGLYDSDVIGIAIDLLQESLKPDTWKSSNASQ